MPPRKQRIAVVFDTNLIVRRFLRRTSRSVNSSVYNLWSVERRLQLIVSQPIIDEYIGLLWRIGIEASRVARFQNRLLTSATVTKVRLGKRFEISRDPDDNVFLSTAHAGRAEYLITNDRDLLDISEGERKAFRFDIVTPAAFLRAINQ